MEFIRIVVENALFLLVMAAFFLFSSCAGFLGMVVGHYRSEDQPRKPFREYYLAKERELWVAHHKEGVTITVALIVFGHVGIVLGLLFAIGKAKKVVELPVIDRRKVG